MRVTLKLYASLGQYLPPQAERNAVVLDVPETTSISALLDAHHVPTELCHLVMLNGIFQAPAVRGSVMVKPGDVIAVWPPVAGG